MQPTGKLSDGEIAALEAWVKMGARWPNAGDIQAARQESKQARKLTSAPYGFTIWMAGGGVKGGMAYGATDEFGYHAMENRMRIHDLHATILQLTRS